MTREIVENYRTDDFWEVSGYDSADWLRELANYIGWNDWFTRRYIDV